MTTTAYSFGSVAATLDGQRVIGFWDGDDPVAVSMVAERGTGVTGADGSGIFSINASRAATISLKLQHTSPTHRLLTEKMKLQHAMGSAARPFPFAVIDTGSNEGGSAAQCLIQSSPVDSKGQNASVREWVLWTADWNTEVPNV